jgi:hypothetical protein
MGGSLFRRAAGRNRVMEMYPKCNVGNGFATAISEKMNLCQELPANFSISAPGSGLHWRYYEWTESLPTETISLFLRRN